MKITKRQLRLIIREAALKESLWKNVHAKREEGRPPAKPGDEGYPDEEAWKSAQEGDYDEGEDVIEELLSFIQEQDKDRMKCNNPRYIKDGETGHGKKQKVVKACDPDSDKEKIIRFGDAKMRNNSDKKKNKKNFRSRHNCADKNMKKDWDAAGYWACKDW